VVICFVDAPLPRTGTSNRCPHGAHRGAKEFDRLFAGVQFSEVDGDILFCFAMNEELAAEMEDKYALHISMVASDILKTEIGIVMVLPRVLQ